MLCLRDLEGLVIKRCPVFLLLWLVGCQPPPAPPAPPRPALVMDIQPQIDSTSTGFIGEIRSRYETPQGFRVSGKISRRLVDTGAQVRKGQLLVELDPLDNQLNSQAAQAQLSEAQAELNLAQAELARVEKLRERQFVSQQALDIQQARFKTSAAKLQQIKAQALVVEHQTQYTKLAAERDGVVTLIRAEPGQVVDAGEVIVQIAVPDSKEVLLAVPESRMTGIQANRTAQIILWANPEKILAGHVREVAPAADTATRTFQVRIALDENNDNIRLGMTARVRFLQDTANSILLPTPAVSQRDGQHVVWIVDSSNQVHPRPVKISDYREDGVLILQGLNAGEKVVIAGIHTLIPGQTVQPQMAEHPL